MAPRHLVLPILCALAAPTARAQQVVTSTEPQSVGVTIYHPAENGWSDELDLDWLQGYALITEQRRVRIPAGRSVIRFEGVAGGMMPETALVRGLPFGVREKNLDADLLSPASLYARSIGRPVLLRRVNAKTGALSEERAIVRSGPDGAAILQTRTGFVAADCGKEHEDLVYSEVPAGLSSRPTLSIETEAPEATEVTLALSYLAWGFDWQSNYVINYGEDGGKPEMTAWVTLASSDPTSFVAADTSVIAGEVNREDDYGEPLPEPRQLTFKCFFRPVSLGPGGRFEEGADGVLGDIVVTARRMQQSIMDSPLAITALSPQTVTEETVGDLPLLRIPVPTTVASNSQKQVALFSPHRVDFKPVYMFRAYDGEGEEARSTTLVLVTRNRKQEGLGQSLPRGKVAVFEHGLRGPMLIGDGQMANYAVGQDVEVYVGQSDRVTVKSELIRSGANWHELELTATNANAWPVNFELLISAGDDYEAGKFSARLGRKYALPMWRKVIPANGTVTLRYRLKEKEAVPESEDKEHEGN